MCLVLDVLPEKINLCWYLAKLEIGWLCSESFSSSDISRDLFIGYLLAETRGCSFRHTVFFLRYLKAYVN